MQLKPLALATLIAIGGALTTPAFAEPSSVNSTLQKADSDALLNQALDAQAKGDLATAAKLLKQGADKGDALAQSLLGTLYYEGAGVPKDLKRAVDYWWKAADQGDGEAAFSLGVLYSVGFIKVPDVRVAGVKPNQISALVLYALASDSQPQKAMGNVEALARTMTQEQVQQAQQIAQRWRPGQSLRKLFP